MQHNKPTIALTMGDPAGVGPEICLRALADVELNNECQLIVFGDAGVLLRCAQTTGLAAPKTVLRVSDLSSSVSEACVIDLQCMDAEQLVIGEVSAACGQASFEYIEAAIAAALAGKVDAVTTAPINKEALRSAGIHYPGHTEIFAERAASDRWCMMQFSPEITCTFVTVHCGYAEVPKLLTVERVLETIELTAESLTVIHGRNPRIVVCGLNPHAGEHGLFGDREEERIISPAIEESRRRGLLVEGPLPPDTAFLPAKRRTTDAFVCMYHDQGHIPLKALAFDSAVNTTLGLKVIRTSVDHGTAYDIAWQGTASCSSLFAAIRLAGRLVGLRGPRTVGH
ncbi:MAG: 4-hydroxythreonine-4-phosphate dehydrogenase PdxA [Pirellulaceae bacterium]|nr:4-hydroxythreonine-4-phosphate dehydrogenase PdxA [Pirellulaceae bacterium]